MQKGIFISILSLATWFAVSQPGDYAELQDQIIYGSYNTLIDTTVQNAYPFVNWDSNQILFADQSPALQRFFARFDSLVRFKDRQLVVYHFGGSHLQADIYSHKVRTYMKDLVGIESPPRGLIFPFKLARSNNPSNYRVTFTGEWKGHRSVLNKDTLEYGIEAIAASTNDIVTSIRISVPKKEELKLKYNKVKVYHNPEAVDLYKVWLKEERFITSVRRDRETGFTEFELSKNLDTLNLIIYRRTKDTTRFILHGMELWNEDAGVIYNAVGANGNSFRTYLKSTLLKPHLMERPPDLVVISIGTNDANVPADKFKPEKYEQKYRNFLDTMLSVNPDAAIILTVPNDSYYRRRYANRNTEKVRQVILKLAQEYQMGVWDLYSIMGGFGSSHIWYRNKIMKSDRIHFTRDGYYIKGDLFYQAFLRSIYEYKTAEQ